MAIYVQDKGALRGFCRAFAGDLLDFTVRMQGFYWTLEAGYPPLPVQNVEEGITVLWKFCQGFPEFLPGFSWEFTSDLWGIYWTLAT
ncbi:MAG: hypothetical protein DPW09_02915 [Anaerolineae bacterium]|nr:hypothetical protein [Anaerolineae bacterium]